MLKIKRRRVGLLTGFAVTYVLLLLIGRHLTLFDSDGPPVAWPAAGLLFGAYLITRRRHWPGLTLVACASVLAAYRLAEVPLWRAPLVFPIVLGPPALGAWLIGWLERRFKFDEAYAEEIRATALILVGGFLVPALVAFAFTVRAYFDGAIEVTRLYVTLDNGDYFRIWRDHFAGPSLGILTITPFVVAADHALRHGITIRSWRSLAIDLIILAAACAMAGWSFEIPTVPLEVRSPSIIMPFLVLTSLRGKMTLTTVANLLVSWIMIGSTLRHHGAFAVFFTDPAARTTVLQVFVVVNVFSQTLFTAIIAGRTKLAASLRSRGEELERLNEDLIRAKEDAVRADAAKSRVLATVTHEIRTPLGAMIGFADLALGETPPEEKDRYIEIVRRNGVRLNELVNDTLDLSKIEAGHLEIDRQLIDVKDLTAEVVDLMQIKAREKKLSLQVVHGPNLPTSFCSDPLRVRQVLMNLIGNAIKFTSIGRVTLRVNGLSTKGKRGLEFEVEDTGIGLDPAQSSHLFEAFRQASAQTARTFGGTGLGLNLSREIARLLGGDVELKCSRPSVGTTFRFHVTELTRDQSADTEDLRPTPPSPMF